MSVLQLGKCPMFGFGGRAFAESSRAYKLRGMDIADGFCGAFVAVKGDRTSEQRFCTMVVFQGPPRSKICASKHSSAVGPEKPLAVKFWLVRKARKECHFFKRHYGCTYICDRCFACKLFKCSVPELNFGDVSVGAPWRATEISHEQYLAQDSVLSPWCAVPGFRLETALGDLMHDLWLGVAGDAIASALVELWEFGFLVPPDGGVFASACDAFSAVRNDSRKYFRRPHESKSIAQTHRQTWQTHRYLFLYIYIYTTCRVLPCLDDAAVPDFASQEPQHAGPALCHDPCFVGPGGPNQISGVNQQGESCAREAPRAIHGASLREACTDGHAVQATHMPVCCFVFLRQHFGQQRPLLDSGSNP